MRRTDTEPVRPARPPGYSVIVVDRRRVAWLLGATIVLLVVGSYVTYAFLWGVEGEGVGGEVVESVARLFDVDEENNVPTWFSSMLLLLVALGLHDAAQQAVRFRGRLHVMAAGFVVLSLDETAQLHEMGNRAVALAAGLPDDQPLWLLPAAILVVAALWYAVPVWRSLGPPARRLWSIGAASFVAGAIGVELIAAPYWPLEASGFVEDPGARFVYAALVSLEEGLEMLGALCFLLGAWRIADQGTAAPGSEAARQAALDGAPPS